MTLEKLEAVFLQAVQKAVRNEEACYIAATSSVTKSIPLSHILYFEIRNRIITIHHDGQSFDCYEKLDTVERELSSKGFLRTHRSFLVNCAYIDCLKKSNLFLRDGTCIPVSSKHYRDMKEKFSNYLISG